MFIEQKSYPTGGISTPAFRRLGIACANTAAVAPASFPQLATIEQSSWTMYGRSNAAPHVRVM
jgi:hypothetical protein